MRKATEIWENRYATGGNSGAGSYGDSYEFKRDVINDYIKKFNIKNVLDLGCGDGNQITELSVEKYSGFDISQCVVDLCRKKYENDSSKQFNVYDNNFKNDQSYDLCMSIDVIYHIIDDSDFNCYMCNLFNPLNKYILIYSTNYESVLNGHMRHRKFDSMIPKTSKFIEKIKNKVGYDADFYLYKNE